MNRIFLCLSLLVVTAFSLNAQTEKPEKEKSKCKVAGVMVSATFNMNFGNYFSALRNGNFVPGIGLFWVNQRGDNHILSASVSGGFGVRAALTNGNGTGVTGVLPVSISLSPEYQYRMFIKPNPQKKYRFFVGVGGRLGLNFWRNDYYSSFDQNWYSRTNAGFSTSLIFEPGIRFLINERLFLDASLPLTLTRTSFSSSWVSDPGSTTNFNYDMRFMPSTGVKLALGILR